jgi:hypothetical protein
MKTLLPVLLALFLLSCTTIAPEPAFIPPTGPVPETPVVAPEPVPSPEPVPAPADPLETRLLAITQQGTTLFTAADVAYGDTLTATLTLADLPLSLLAIRSYTLDASVVIQNHTQNYTTMRIVYRADGKTACVATVPKSVIDPVVWYKTKNPAAKDNPYLRAYWSTVTFECDEDIPEVYR